MKPNKLISLLLMFTSCVFMNDKTTEWLGPYYVDETITFETSNGTDWLLIKNKTLYDTQANYEGYFYHQNTKYLFSVVISSRIDGNVDFEITFAGRQCHGGADSRNKKEQGTELRDTIVIDDANSEYISGSLEPDNCEYLKWSKKEGLIEYRLRDGTIYPKP